MRYGAGKISEKLRALAALTDDWNSVPNTYGQVAHNSINSHFKETVYVPLASRGTIMYAEHINMCRQTFI